MGALSNCLLIVTAEVDKSVEAAWGRWYDDTHLPAALACVRSITSVPIVTGFPFGHCAKKLTLAVGAAIDVEVRSGQCRVRQRWDLPAR